MRYDFWKLPLYGLVKAYCAVKNWCGGVGPIPEGMSIRTALRVQKFRANHAAIKARLLEGVGLELGGWIKQQKKRREPAVQEGFHA